MKIGAHIVAIALAGALTGVQVPLQAAESWSSLNMRPMHAVSFDEGDKHVVSYFLNQSGVCKLTVMIEDMSRADEPAPAKPSRMQVSVAPGKAARFDTVEGKTRSFACEDDARSMSVTELDHLAFRETSE
jgi:hypothetical protein